MALPGYATRLASVHDLTQQGRDPGGEPAPPPLSGRGVAMDIAARMQAHKVVTDRGGRRSAQPAMPGTDELTLPAEVVHQRVRLVDHLIVRTAPELARQPVEHRTDLDRPAGVLLL